MMSPSQSRLRTICLCGPQLTKITDTESYICLHKNEQHTLCSECGTRMIGTRRQPWCSVHKHRDVVFTGHLVWNITRDNTIAYRPWLPPPLDHSFIEWSEMRKEAFKRKHQTEKGEHKLEHLFPLYRHVTQKTQHDIPTNIDVSFYIGDESIPFLAKISIYIGPSTPKIKKHFEITPIVWIPEIPKDHKLVCTIQPGDHHYSWNCNLKERPRDGKLSVPFTKLPHFPEGFWNMRFIWYIL